MNSLQVEYFLTVCKYMSFTEAARVLYVSQPAVSRQISSIEKEIGLPLFDRNYRSLRLTPAGELVRDAFIKMGNIFESTLNEAKQRNAKSAGTLSLGSPSGWLLSKVLPPNMMGKMKADYPNISCSIQHLTYDGLYQKLQQNSLDAVFIYQSDSDSEQQNFESMIVRRVALRLYYYAPCPLSQDELTRETLERETFYICPEMERANIVPRLKHFCNDRGFEPNIVTLPNVESVISTVDMGFGGMIVFDDMHKLAVNPRFKYTDLPIDLDICLVWSRDVRNPVLEVFLNELHLLLKK